MRAVGVTPPRLGPALALWSMALLGMFLSGIAVAQERRDLEAIVDAGELRVGVSLYAPWSMRSGSGELVGAEVDIARQVAADMGVKPRLREYAWAELIPALNRGEIDIIIAGLSVTPQRALEVAYSQPYRRSGTGLATNLELTREFNSLNELNRADVAIAVMSETQSAELARRLFDQAAIKTFEREEQAEKALVEGLVHAYVRAEPVPRYLALRHPERIDTPLNQPLMVSREAFAVRQGDPALINFLNAWIIAREDEAWLDSNREYWFESLEWRQQVEQ